MFCIFALVMEKILYDKELGNITLRTSPRAVRYWLKIRNGAILAVMPENGKVAYMLAFINKERKKLLRMLQNYSSPRLVLDEANEMQTHTFRLHIFRTDRKGFYMNLNNGMLHIACPFATDFKEEKTQQLLKNLLEKALRHEANRLLPLRLDILAKQHGFSFANVRISKTKSRWGSCNTRGNINLSLSLMLLPGHLIDYVLLHELCHTVEMNHGERFWNLMNRVTGNQALVLRNELKTYHTLPSL